MSKQLAKSVLMVRPTSFGFNEEAAETNSFQNIPEDKDSTQEKALAEFNGFVEQLTDLGIDVIIYEKDCSGELIRDLQAEFEGSITLCSPAASGLLYFQLEG